MDLKKGQETEAKAEAKEFPGGLVIIYGLILLAALLIHIIPGGEYVRTTVDGGEMIDPNSFSYMASHPAPLLEIFTSVPKGFQATSWICSPILIVGGVFSVISNTGAIQVALSSLLEKSKGKDIFFVPVIVLLLSTVPTLVGTLETYPASVPLGIMLARPTGLDALVGITITVCVGGVGLVGGIMNLFNIDVAQGLVGSPVFSDIWLRILAFIGLNVSVSFWTMEYAIILKKDKKNSWIYDVGQRAEGLGMVVEMPEFDAKRKSVLLSVLVGIGYIIYLALTDGDFKNGIPAAPLMMLVVVGIVMKYFPSEVSRRSGKGAQGAVGGVLVVEFVEAIALILDNSGTVDTITRTAVQMLNNASGVLTAEITYLIGHIGNFFIISDAELAIVLVPILSPIGDMAGIMQQTICVAAILGGAPGNMITPTSSLASGATAMAGIDYRVYSRFVICIFLTNFVWVAIPVAIAAIIQIGSF